MILKNPTWPSLFPGTLRYNLIDNKRAFDLQKELNIKGAVYQAMISDEISNFYMIHDEMNHNKYFIKFVSQEYLSHYEEAEKIGHWLKTQGIPVNTAIKYDNGAYSRNGYLVYPFITGTPLSKNQETLVLFGQSLATLHQKLRDYPSQDQLITKTQCRLTKLNDIREKIADGKLNIGPIPGCVKKLAKSSNLDFNQGHSIQALHGDLNPGNVLLNDNIIYYLDFEDTLHSVLPIVYELVYILERMVFVSVTDQKTRINLGRSFIQAYINNNGNYSYCKSDDLALSTLALRAFCVLTLCELEGKKIDSREWYKFQKLATLAEITQDTLKTILQA